MKNDEIHTMNADEILQVYYRNDISDTIKAALFDSLIDRCFVHAADIGLDARITRGMLEDAYRAGMEISMRDDELARHKNNLPMVTALNSLTYVFIAGLCTAQEYTGLLRDVCRFTTMEGKIQKLEEQISKFGYKPDKGGDFK